MSNEIVVSDQTVNPSSDGGSSQTGGDASTGLSRAQIEHIRATDFDRYVYERLDKKLIAMTASELGQESTVEPMAPDSSQAVMSKTEAGRELIRSLESLGGFKYQLQRLQVDVGKLVENVGNSREQRVFMERFDRSLPEAVRFAIYDTLATMGNDAYVQPVTADEVQHFKADPAAAELVKEWASEAPTKIARIWRRTHHLQDLTGTLTHFRAWFDQLSDREAKRVLEFAAR